MESCNKSRMERDDVVLSLSGYAAALSRRASRRHGFEYDDSYQHIMTTALSEWRDEWTDENPAAYVTVAMRSSILDFISMWYAKGRVLNRHSDDVAGIDISDGATETDPLFMKSVAVGIEALPERNKRTVSEYFMNDKDVSDMDFIGRSAGQDHIKKFIEAMQEKFGVEKVARRVKEGKEVYVIVSPDGVEESGTLNELCKRTGLDNGGLRRVCLGQRNHIKGWSLIK